MDNKPYHFANLSSPTVKQIQSLEKTITEETGEEIILISYKNEDQ